MKTLYLLFFLPFIVVSCSNLTSGNNQEMSYDETGCLYTSYDSLVMVGYQGWFAAEGDGSNRGWHHYQKNGEFKPGFSSIDMWPDVSEYSNTYKTNFLYPDGSPAKVYSSSDEQTIDVHFKWMKDYGIDGVFLQRFVVEIKNSSGKAHFNKVLENALKASKKYGRALSIMYDLSGCTSDDLNILLDDWEEIQSEYALFDNVENPTYLRHNKKPVMSIWGVGFNDGRKYSLNDVDKLITSLKGDKNDVSIKLGVPYFWRTLNNDTENNILLHSIIKKCDIILPWAVGRYNSDTYEKVSDKNLKPDLMWCEKNGISYIPLAFPGFSWGNLKNNPSVYNQIPRDEGDFLWKQISGAKLSGAKSLYIAMFDEIDEGTAIFKTLKENETPLNGDGKFIGIESNLESDYYLWLAGEGTKWFHGNENYTKEKPNRKY